MKTLPTDLEVLNAIYERYYNEFARGESKRSSKAFVPIDIASIAESLAVDWDIVFGRL